MMEFCLEKAAEHNAQHLWLGVWEKNARARAFYQKWQFAVEGQHVFCVGDDPQIDYWMVRPVKAA
jgi:ribosomal protein S18 acetylase RimI-like enzyme